MHVAVIGAGMSGLAAALHLAEAGVEVTVLDPRPAVGGMVRTSTFAGRQVDEAADAFLVRTPAALHLARRVGLGAELVHPAVRKAHVWHDGALHPFPPQVMGVPTDIEAAAESGLLTPDGLARLRRDLTDAATPLPAEDVTIADAIGERIGPEALALLVDPLVGGINAGDTARQSLAAVVPQLDAARRDPDHASLIEACRAQVSRARAAGADPAAPIFAAPDGGMARLPHAVAEAAVATGRVELRLGQTVEAIDRGPRLVVSGGDDIAPDGVVVATPGHVAARLLATAAPDAAARLGQVDHVSVAFIRLALRVEDVATVLDGSGLLVPRRSGLAVTACSWASSKWERLRPEHGDGTVVLRAAVGRDGDQAALGLADDDLVGLVVDELTPILGLRGGPVEADVVRWDDAFPQYRPGPPRPGRGHRGRAGEGRADGRRRRHAPAGRGHPRLRGRCSVGRRAGAGSPPTAAPRLTRPGTGGARSGPALERSTRWARLTRPGQRHPRPVRVRPAQGGAWRATFGDAFGHVAY